MTVESEAALMDMDNLRELAGDPQFIPGVYNYCDRWCERCPLTARCLVYATEQDSGDDPTDHDIQSAAFWEKLGRMFEQTKQMILDDARKRGIDLGPIDVEPERRRRRRQKARAKKNELVQLGMSYLKGARDWFQANEALVEQKKRDLVHLAEMGLEGRDPEADAIDIGDAFEVVRWYQFQITVKLRRALSDPRLDQELKADGFPSDADGSAKVALIGIDRSIAAWARLRRHFPEAEGAILDLLVTLERLRRGTEARFPEARAFKRPGFDDA